MIKRDFKLNRVIKNFISLTVANIIGQILMFIAVVFTARYFGPKEFGITNFSNAIITYFTAIASFGLQTLGTIQIAKSDRNNNEKINIINSLRIVLALFSYVLIIVFVLIINKSIVCKLNILLYGLTVFPTAIYVDWIFNANEEMQYNSRAIIIKNLVYSIIVLVSLFFIKIKNINYLAVYMFIATLLSSIYLLLKTKQYYKIKFRFIWNLSQYKFLISSAWPFFFSGIFATINSNIDTIMLGFMKSEYEVGIYNSVYKIVNVFIMVAGLLFTPIYPSMIKYYNNKQTLKLNNLVNDLRKLMYIVAIPLIFAAFVLNKEIIITLYGNQYKEAYSVFTILISYVALLFIREVYGYLLNACNLQKNYMKIVLISSTYNIISNLLLINKFGIKAAALNTLISEFINLICMFKVGRIKVRLKFRNNFIIRIFICSFIMSIGLYLFKSYTSNAIILVIVGIVIYFIMLFICRVLTISEIKNYLLEKED